MTHMTSYPIKELKNKQLNQGIDFEPEGLYYAKKYKRFFEYILDHHSDKYIYGIIPKNKKIYTTIDKPNKNLILQIKTKKDDDKYIKKYKVELSMVNKYHLVYFDIDFEKVAQDFGGIEFSDISGKHSYYCIKNYGCIWNTDIIKKLELMAKK